MERPTIIPEGVIDLKIMLAPDSFKGSLGAAEAAESMEKGIRKVLPGAEIVKIPLSDGGEGLVETLVRATGGEFLYKRVTGPLGEPVEACWGILGGRDTAVIEMASASGLSLVPEDQRCPLHTTTYGTGELIKEALGRACKRIILGIGGSATNDGGAGMAQALGAKLTDESGAELPFGGAALCGLAGIDVSSLDARIKGVDVQVACDVDNPLTGPRGASMVYGPQKGGSPETLRRLDSCLSRYAFIVSRDLGVDVEHVPGSGAAGGLGAGCLAFLNARLESGIELVIDAVGLEKELATCDLVITGEGKLDSQSIHGKVPIGVARLGKKHQVPVIILAGSVEEGLEYLYEEGVTAYFSIINAPLSVEAAVDNTARLLEMTTAQVLNLVKSCSDIKK